MNFRNPSAIGGGGFVQKAPSVNLVKMVNTCWKSAAFHVVVLKVRSADQVLTFCSDI